MAGNPTIQEGQAVIIYAAFIDEARHEIENFYYKTRKWCHGKDFLSEDPISVKANQELKDRVFNTFDTLHDDIMDKLAQFKHDGRTLDGYHKQSDVLNEWNHIANHIFSTLAIGSNGIVEYSKLKAERLKSNFNIWLKDK